MYLIYGKGKVGNAVAELLQTLNKEYILADDQDITQEMIEQAQWIIASPGIKQSHGIYQNHKSKIISELDLLAILMSEIGFSNSSKNLTFVGITATNGKSSTTWILYNLLKQVEIQKNVWICGNFDIPLSQIFTQIIKENKQQEEHIFVVECSSFMLYELRNFVFDYSLLLNVATDHLDWHKDMEEYIDSKVNLLRHTKKHGWTNEAIFDRLDAATKSHVSIYTPTFDLTKTNFIGKHNQENFGAIQSFLQQRYKDQNLIYPTQAIDQAIQTISPLDHRLKQIKIIEDIKIIDDGICTSSQALNAALESFDEKVVVICGGYDKGDDYSRLAPVMKQKVAYGVFMGMTAPKFQAVAEAAQVPCEIQGDLHSTMQIAFTKAKALGIKTLLFSPGAASFDMFKNVYDRANKFLTEVELLGK